MTLKEMVLQRLSDLRIQPKRSLGQNFLISEYVVGQIFQEYDSVTKDFCVEVGPGLGVLTEPLIERKTKCILIEMDRTFSQYWRERDQNVMEADALKYDWSAIEKMGEQILVLSNLPYQIGSRLVIDLSVGPKNLKNMILMFQKEVAQRLEAVPRSEDYGFLSVIAQSYWSVRKVVDAKSHDFYPAPKVDSRVMRFSRIEGVEDLDAGFIKFVKAAFQFRRKFMVKSFPQTKQQLISALDELGYSEKVRAEEITVPNFQSLYKNSKKW